MKKILLPVACALCAFTANADDALTLVSTTPVTIASGFNVDCVAEQPGSESTDKATYPYMDGHHSMLLVNGEYIEGTVTKGLPTDGAITTASGYKYQLAAYDKNNDLYLGKKGESGTLVFETPVSATHLGVIMCPTDGYDGGTYSNKFSAVVNYEDGTSLDVASRLTPDWGSAKAYDMGQRFRGDGNPVENCTVNMHEEVIEVDANKKVKSIYFLCESEAMDGYWGGYTCLGQFNFLGVSALVLEAAGIEGIAVDNATVEAVYNVAGVKSNDVKKGINIVKYSNGVVRKVIVK
jgi:hypothetical protein